MGRGSLGRVLLLQVSSHLVPLLLQESSHLVPLLLQESSLHFLSFFVKTFLVYFYYFPIIISFLHLSVLALLVLLFGIIIVIQLIPAANMMPKY